jgi:aromatic-L-amino-acid/L-tryptophan decarboxylase
VCEIVVNYLENIGDRPVVSTVSPGYLRKLLPSSAPQTGESWSDIQADIETKIMPGITHWQHPSFFAFFPCPNSYPSILGELYSAALPGAFFNWICSPAVTELETIVLDWLAKAIGLPECYLSTGPTRGGGVIAGTASESVVVTMVAARDKYLRETVDQSLEGEEREEAMITNRCRLVALASSMAHSGTKKAAKIIGVRYREIPVRAEDSYAMTGASVRKVVEECRAKGLEPFYLTTTLGTTDTCAVDDFADIAATLAEIAPAEKPGEIWVHLDAAFAGSALLLPTIQAQIGMDTLAKFHSFDMNMHKWLVTNFDASTLWVRDRSWLVSALSSHMHVYENEGTAGGLVTDYRDWQIPLGRRFRSLKIWFVLRSYGIKGLQEYIQRGIDMGVMFANMLKSRADLFEIVTGPSFALTVFRVAAKNPSSTKELALDQRNALTRKVCEAINSSGKMWVTSTMLDARFAIRLQTAVAATEEKHVKDAFALIISATEEVLKGEVNGVVHE